MRAALFLVALVALDAEAQSRPRYTSRICKRNAGGRSTRGIPCGDQPAFAFASPNGAGLPYAVSLCDTLTDAEFSGGWCLRGDGTMRTGSSLTMTPTGLLTQAQTVCPNGPNCGAITTARMEAGRRFVSSISVLPYGPGQTVCWHGQQSSFPGNGIVIAHFDGVYSVSCSQLSGTFQCTYQNTLAATSAVSAAATLGVWHLWCASYAESDPVARGYLDGVAGVPGASLSPAALNAANVPWSIGESPSAGFTNFGQLGGAFAIPVQLTPARIAAIARAVLADAPTGARGETMTFTRASQRFCDNGSGSGSDLPNGRPCITRGGISRYGAATNLILRNDELDNAAWANVGVPVVTANAYVHPNGTLTADSIADDQAGSFEGRSQVVTTSTLARYTFSCYLRGAVGGEDASLTITGTGNAAGDATCNFTGLTTSFSRRICTSAVTYAAGLTAVTGAVRVGDAVGDTGTIGATRCELVADTRPGPSVRTDGVAVATVVDGWSLAATGLSTATGCLAADFVPEFWDSTSTTGGNYNLLGFDANGRLFGNTSTRVDVFDGTTTLNATPSPVLTAGAATRVRVTYASATMNLLVGVATASGAFDGTFGASAATIGPGTTSAAEMNGVLRSVEADPLPSRCTP